MINIEVLLQAAEFIEKQQQQISNQQTQKHRSHYQGNFCVDTLSPLSSSVSSSSSPSSSSSSSPTSSSVNDRTSANVNINRGRHEQQPLCASITANINRSINISPPLPYPSPSSSSCSSSSSSSSCSSSTASSFENVRFNSSKAKAATVQSSTQLQKLEEIKRDKAIHNTLEKNRRAHLKDCFENLQNELPQYKDKKVTNLLILNYTLKYIEQAKRKDRENELEKQRQLKRQSQLRQNLKKLIDELDAAENFDYKAWINTNDNKAEDECSSNLIPNDNTTDNAFSKTELDGNQESSFESKMLNTSNQRKRTSNSLSVSNSANKQKKTAQQQKEMILAATADASGRNRHFSCDENTIKQRRKRNSSSMNESMLDEEYDNDIDADNDDDYYDDDDDTDYLTGDNENGSRRNSTSSSISNELIINEDDHQNDDDRTPTVDIKSPLSSKKKRVKQTTPTTLTPTVTTPTPPTILTASGSQIFSIIKQQQPHLNIANSNNSTVNNLTSTIPRISTNFTNPKSILLLHQPVSSSSQVFKPIHHYNHGTSSLGGPNPTTTSNGSSSTSTLNSSLNTQLKNQTSNRSKSPLDLLQSNSQQTSLANTLNEYVELLKQNQKQQQQQQQINPFTMFQLATAAAAAAAAAANNNPQPTQTRIITLQQPMSKVPSTSNTPNNAASKN